MAGMTVNDFNRRQHPFLGYNKSVQGTFDNPTGSEYTLEQGQVIAKDASTGKLVVHDSTNTAPGAKIPFGIVGSERTLAPNESGVTVTVVTCGYVRKDDVKVGGSDSLSTQITIQDGSSADTGYSRSIEDMLRGETEGIHLVAVTELTDYDNS
jgi:NDP-sugar pyrophosphorylase family protein